MITKGPLRTWTPWPCIFPTPASWTACGRRKRVRGSNAERIRGALSDATTSGGVRLPKVAFQTISRSFSSRIVSEPFFKSRNNPLIINKITPMNSSPALGTKRPCKLLIFKHFTRPLFLYSPILVTFWSPLGSLATPE